ncbi:tripartite tricarboxylate transporter substrate binding protein [Roseomonas indoligenes]|uniref:Tripartite tricarboxylate transporter substrate binding protein n=1 Tax=Roseomonas indoligenes TaxID=2820811 RepID=A0A940N4C4_9PROT|nr:tripartite tricarboxylate transporter substrate binding protein [Pararoseomonas indoligenes]MBP0495736.1 tripartite tricarboxylate transporter substrate binding protein [Pararoseomonas indoligenes]
MNRRTLLGGAVAAAGARKAWAQDFPDRPMRLVVPYAPGGVVDYVGRVFAQGLSEPLKQSVVAENRPGAGGVVGADFVAKSAPDGYTQLVIDPALVINPSLQARVPYDVFRDFRPISILTSSPLVLVVPPELPARDIEGFIALVKASRARFSYASAGVGTTPHLAGEMFSLRTGCEATHVPYRGIAAGYADMMTGQVQFCFSSIAGARGLVADGKLRALATTGARRSAVFPNLPTMQEAGMEGFVVDLWLSLLAPAATPDAVAAKMHAAVMSVIAKPETGPSLDRVGAEVRGTTGTEATAALRVEYETWRKLIADAKITV